MLLRTILCRPAVYPVLLVFSLGLLSPLMALEVRVPVKSRYEERQEYPIALIKFILNKAGADYRIVFNDSGVTTQARDIDRLRFNQGINLCWFGTKPELEEELVPVRYPMWRGLLGYRIFIINKDNQHLFNKVQSLRDLQKFTGDQGIGWSDTQILEHSGLKQEETEYDLIFAKVQVKHTDYFSRGIGEAFREVEIRRKEFPDLAIEQQILLVYPFAGFFFTNKENRELARTMEEGFRRAYEDGSFGEFFYNHPAVKKIFEQGNIEKRIRIEIPNPLLTPETSGIADKYWHGR